MSSHEDIVIGYHKGQESFLKKLATKLRSRGLSVWYSQPGDDGKKTSEAILGCKVYIPIMTEESAVDKNISEQLSLAYISNSSIYPIAQSQFKDLSPKLNGGARLMLAKINWSFVLNDDEFEEKTDVIIGSIQKDIDKLSQKQVSEGLKDAGFVSTHGMDFSLAKGHVKDLAQQNQGADLSALSQDMPFWDRHFPGKKEVPWTDFRDKFVFDYEAKITEEFPENTEERKQFFVNLMYKDVFNLSKIVSRATYNKFCDQPHPHAFFLQMQEYAIAYMSLRNVISMDSSLRIPTIQSLGQFTFPAIVSGLTDMLTDDDPNIRAVAAIALAHAGKNQSLTVDKIIKLLEDEDRLVRESACLSLGYLRSTRAVQSVVDRWRNDPISTVREAAELALSRMDAPDAQRCMKVTQILSSEMNALKPVMSTRL